MPPLVAGERLPFLSADGTLVIPFDSPERFHWWKGGQVAAGVAGGFLIAFKVHHPLTWAVRLMARYQSNEMVTNEALDRAVCPLAHRRPDAWARDPDSIVVLTPHEEADHFTVTSILRNLPQLPEFVLGWDYPLMKVASDLNPDALRRPQSKNKVCSDREFVEDLITTTPTSRAAIVAKGGELAISSATIDRYLKRLSEAGLISSGGGLYWRK